MENFLVKLKIIYRTLLPAFLVALIFVIFYLFAKFLLPFVLATIIVLIVYPLVRWLERLGLKRWLAVTISLLAFYSTATLIIVLTLVKVSNELVTVTTKLPAFVQHINSLMPSLLEVGQRYYDVLPQEVLPYIQSGLQQLSSVGISLAQRLGTWIFSLFALMPVIIIVLIFTILASFFIAIQSDKIIAWFFSFFSPLTQTRIKQIGAELLSATFKFFKAQLILITITFVLTFIGLLILKVNYVAIGALLVAIFDLLPILGPGGIFIPWAIYLLVVKDVYQGIGMLIVYAVIFFTRQFLHPKILAETMELPTLPLLVLLYLGLTLFGIMGLLLAPFVLVFYQSIKKTMRRG